MLTGQIAPSVPFLVTPAHSPQQVEKAAKTRFLAKIVHETQELISCRTVRCHGRESDVSWNGTCSRSERTTIAVTTIGMTNIGTATKDTGNLTTITARREQFLPELGRDRSKIFFQHLRDELKWTSPTTSLGSGTALDVWKRAK
jgi:hypothetical protein